MDGYSGDAGDAIMAPPNPYWVSNGMMFTTMDNDNDARVYSSCAIGGGWWFADCSSSEVNLDGDGIWQTHDAIWDVQTSRMLVKVVYLGCYHTEGQSQWVKCQDPDGAFLPIILYIRLITTRLRL